MNDSFVDATAVTVDPVDTHRWHAHIPDGWNTPGGVHGGVLRAGGQGAGDGFFGAADGHFVEGVPAEEGFAGRSGDVAAHLVEVRLAEERAFGVGARPHVVERGPGEIAFAILFRAHGRTALRAGLRPGRRTT